MAAAAELVERGLARRPVGLRQHGAGVAVSRVFPRCHIHRGVLQQNTVSGETGIITIISVYFGLVLLDSILGGELFCIYAHYWVVHALDK